MKTITTILAIMMVSVIFAQTPQGMVLVEDYPTEYDNTYQNSSIKVLQTNTTSTIIRDRQPLRASNEYFVIGNFNRVNVTNINIIELPRTNVDNNNAEYNKSTQFNPDKSLQEILRDE